MKITWLGHAGFRIEIEDQVLLVDPWIAGNPVFPQDRADEATAGATAILLTHGHGDHASNAQDIARDLGIPIACIHEASKLLAADGVETLGFGKGGTISFNSVLVSMVNAVHSSAEGIGSYHRSVLTPSRRLFLMLPKRHRRPTKNGCK